MLGAPNGQTAARSIPGVRGEPEVWSFPLPSQGPVAASHWQGSGRALGRTLDQMIV